MKCIHRQQPARTALPIIHVSMILLHDGVLLRVTTLGHTVFTVATNLGEDIELGGLACRVINHHSFATLVSEQMHEKVFTVMKLV